MSLAPNTDDDRRWTVSEYMSLDDDQRYELYEGKLVMVPSPDIFHQRVVAQLMVAIGSHVNQNELGECFDAPFDVVLGDDTVVQPDFTFIRKGRISELYDGHCVSGAPDLVVEVLAEATESRDRHHKRRLYAKAGVEWLLFVEPKGRVVEVLQLGEDGRYATSSTAADDDILEIGLFPELAIDLSRVWFEAPDES